MSKSGSSVRTPVVDKNGKMTHVWKKDSAVSTSQKLSVSPVVTDSRKDDRGEIAFARALEICAEHPFYEEKFSPILHDMAESYGNPWVGRTRAVFDRGDGYVIKVPLNQEGVMASTNEFSTAEMDDSLIPVADCKFDFSTGMPLLVMEKVDTNVSNRYGKDMPDWLSYVDGAQVGYNSKGELVAYDL